MATTLGCALATGPGAPTHPKPITGTQNFCIEEQGPIQAWCGAIRLFAEAAKNAGPDLNRRTFVEAMSKVTNYPGTLSPV